MKLFFSMALAAALALTAPIVTTPAAAQKAGTAKSTKSKAATPKTAKKAASRKPTTSKGAPKKSATQPSRSAAPKSKKTTSKSRSSGASPCKGLARTQCAANKSCGWITPKKKVSTDGRKLSAYCRKVASKK